MSVWRDGLHRLVHTRVGTGDNIGTLLRIFMGVLVRAGPGRRDDVRTGLDLISQARLGLGNIFYRGVGVYVHSFAQE